ncbi:MAG TPA: MerR family transcriptional regulator [Candidatus Limnocylindria bacterium]|nr:MerR family transcriptional regulator [Candidatus Limnocylindria bacterium]
MYTIGEAADRAGVTPDVLRAWERRYGVVEPRRTAAGYRLYDDAAIRRIRTMRSLVADGWTPSAAAESLRSIADDDLPTVAANLASPDGIDGEDLTRRFVAAASEMNTAGIQAVLDEMGSRASFEPMVDRYLFPALRALGAAWAAGQMSVAAEHAASSMVGRWLGSAYDAAGTTRAGSAPILVGLPAGVRHELAALAFATAARRAGLHVLYIGADVPTDDWVAAARSTNAIASVVGVPTQADVPAARGVLTALRRATPEHIVMLGGDGAKAIARYPALPALLVDAVSALERRLAESAPRSRP